MAPHITYTQWAIKVQLIRGGALTILFFFFQRETKENSLNGDKQSSFIENL